jgi:hypothetical protein
MTIVTPDSETFFKLLAIVKKEKWYKILTKASGGKDQGKQDISSQNTFVLEGKRRHLSGK